jgi:hypothetical protein
MSDQERNATPNQREKPPPTGGPELPRRRSWGRTIVWLSLAASIGSAAGTLMQGVASMQQKNAPAAASPQAPR